MDSIITNIVEMETSSSKQKTKQFINKIKSQAETTQILPEKANIK